MFVVSDMPINREDIVKKVESPEAGAIAIFDGVVRNNADGKIVLKMEYEANKEMAEKMMKELADESMKKYQILGIAMQHRTGMLEIGESSIIIAVASAHRAEAFDACRYLIDTLKVTLPIWKKEYFEEGPNWVKGTRVTV